MNQPSNQGTNQATNKQPSNLGTNQATLEQTKQSRNQPSY